MGFFEAMVALAGIIGGCGLIGLVIWATFKHRADAAGIGDGPSGRRQIELLSTENGNLKGQVSRLEERLSVLERIATDPAERTAREIESLR